MSSAYINELNESDSRLHKEEVLSKALVAAKLGNEISKRFLWGLNRCYDPYIVFNVKQIPSTEGIVNAENPYDDFEILLYNLKNRILTGNSARDAIDAISLRFDSIEWNLFLAPILRRDMRCGISEKTINKVVKNSEYSIKTFSCQLATNCEDRPEMRGKMRLEPKLDGVRVLLMVTNPLNDILQVSITSYSRNGKVFDNFLHIEDQIKSNIDEIINSPINNKYFTSAVLKHGFVLDGEVVGKSFQELMRQARRKENVDALDSVFHVFDIIPLSNFLEGKYNPILEQRLTLLEDMKTVIGKMNNVELLPHLNVDLDTSEGVSKFKRYCNDMVEMGYEGVMIKNLQSSYDCKRNTNWMKYKPVITVDLQIVDVEQGTGRNSSRMGALVCEGVDSDRNIRVNVGSGYSDSDRDEFWASRNELIGRNVEILCDVVTKNQDGTYSLRFPRFVRFRDDK